MESNKKIRVDIPCNEKEIVQKVVTRFNNAYNLEITILKEEDRDGVNFVVIESANLTPNQIFEMGYYFSSLISQMRSKGEIS